MIKFIFIFCLIQIISGVNFDDTLKKFHDEVNDLIESEGVDAIIKIQMALQELQKNISQHLENLSKTLRKESIVARVRRAVDETAPLMVRPVSKFSMVTNFVTCDNLTKVMAEVGSVVSDTSIIVSKVIQTAVNFSISVNNCSANPFCLMGIMLVSGEVIKECIIEIKNFTTDIRFRFKRIFSTIVTCALRYTSTENETDYETDNNNSTEATTIFNDNELQEPIPQFYRRRNNLLRAFNPKTDVELIK